MKNSISDVFEHLRTSSKSAFIDRSQPSKL